MERKLWHECPKCASIFESDISACPPCGTENLNSLYLTIKEVVNRVWPDIQRIWTKQPSLFDKPLAQVRAEERRELLCVLLSLLQRRASLLAADGAHAREAVPVIPASFFLWVKDNRLFLTGILVPSPRGT